MYIIVNVLMVFKNICVRIVLKREKLDNARWFYLVGTMWVLGKEWDRFLWVKSWEGILIFSKCINIIKEVVFYGNYF